MSVLSDIAAMEQRIDQLLDATPVRTSKVRTAAVEAVLSLLESEDLEGLTDTYLEDRVRELLQGASEELTAAVRESITDRVATIIQETKSFYATVDVDAPESLTEAVRRSQSARRVSDALSSGMSLINEKLEDATIEVVKEELSAGDISSERIEDRISERVDSAGAAARTQAKTAINGYNQSYRQELADSADLQHYLYYGNLQANSRRFCREILEGVYTSEQIDQMRNGQIEPVQTFCGGYNCRHSWVPVNPDWDESLELVSGDAIVISRGGSNERTITVIPNPSRS